MDYYILHTFLVGTILLLIIFIICHYFIKQRLEGKDILQYELFKKW